MILMFFLPLQSEIKAKITKECVYFSQLYPFRYNYKSYNTNFFSHFIFKLLS